jgi:hypothetical protein
MHRLAPEAPGAAGDGDDERGEGWEWKVVGSLTAGKKDFVVVWGGGKDPLKEILQRQVEPMGLWIGGLRA